MIGRFAPSTTGEAHPGTLLAALLCWLDVRSRGGSLVLRFEDGDPQRCRPEFLRLLREQLAWFGLDWDREERQSLATERHELAARQLAADGRLYRCQCSRKQIARIGHPGVDGGVVYPGTCRERIWGADDPLPDATDSLRFTLPAGPIRVQDLGGMDLSADVTATLGDPVVRRRDGAWAYHLAGVVDDGVAGVTDIVRGRDLAPSTPLQVALAQALGQVVPRYRHHLLLLEPQGSKLAKFHGAVGVEQLRQIYDPAQLCGLLAQVCGLRAEAAPCRPAELLTGFGWDRVRDADQVVVWTGAELQWRP